MRIINNNELDGREIAQYDSNGFTLKKILKTNEPSHVGFVELGAGGLIGYHDATVAQALFIIDGEGWVRSGEDRRKIQKGQIVVWETGEGHETATDTGLKAIIIESPGLDI